MAITTMDGLVSALGNADVLSWYKTTSTTTIAGDFTSFYQIGGVPALPTIPSSVAAACTSTTGGAPYITKSSTDKVYVASVDIVTTALQTFTLNDRLYHCGNLVGNSTALQSFTVTSTNAMDTGRISTGTYTEWWMECYTTIGATASSFYFDVTYTDASTGTIAIVVASSHKQSRMLKIMSTTQKIIQSITGATLQATTGTAGSWGVTVSRPLFTITPGVVNVGITYDFAQTGLDQISTLACLWWRSWATTTATGVLQANVKLVMG